VGESEGQQYLAGVSSVTRYPLGLDNTPKDSVITVAYEYGVGANNHNYTGFPTHGLGASDSLFEQGNNDYTYQSSVTVCGVVVTETYNHLHLLMERRLENASAPTCNLNLPGEDGAPPIGTRVETRTYPGAPKGEFPPYNALPANYQMPAAVETKTHSATDRTQFVVRKTTSQANDYGPPLDGGAPSSGASESHIETLSCSGLPASSCTPLLRAPI